MLSNKTATGNLRLAAKVINSSPVIHLLILLKNEQKTGNFRQRVKQQGREDELLN